jgi:hypothetical protein
MLARATCDQPGEPLAIAHQLPRRSLAGSSRRALGSLASHARFISSRPRLSRGAAS